MNGVPSRGCRLQGGLGRGVLLLGCWLVSCGLLFLDRCFGTVGGAAWAARDTAATWLLLGHVSSFTLALVLGKVARGIEEGCGDMGEQQAR